MAGDTMEITSEMVASLRAKTGAGLMECKRALVATSGDVEKAVQKLREAGAASAAKRADRVAAEGFVTSYVAPSGKTAALVELNSETDFVARTADFQSFLKSLAQKAAEASPAWKTAADAPQEAIREMAIKLKENVQLRENRFARYDTDNGIISIYIHNTGQNPEGFGKTGVMVELGGEASAANTPQAKQLAKDLAMQIAAVTPKWVSKEDVPAAIIEQEQSIAREQAKRENKPEKIWDKIAQGKVQQFYKMFVLMEQDFVIGEGGGKITVSQAVENVSKVAGGKLAPRRFARFKVGESE